MAVVTDYLEMLCATGSVASGFFFHLGRGFEPVVLPQGTKKGPARQCFMNAGTLAIADPALRYCEGYAMRKGVFPVMHAWCVDENGKAVDPTWGWDSGNEYWGVVLRTKALKQHLVDTRVWGVFAEMVPEPAVRDPLAYLDPAFPPSAHGLDKVQSLLSAMDAMPRRGLACF